MKKNYIYIVSSLLAIVVAILPILASAQVLTVSDVPGAVCANESFTISFDGSAQTYNVGNIFSVELSATDGTFPVTPTIIGALNTTDQTGTIYCTIPTNVTFSSTYKIRVTTSNSSLGAFSGTASGNVDINCTTRNYYWVGGTGNWSDLNHWEFTTDDINFSSATELPTAYDNVNFDDQSFPSGGTLTLDVAASCNDMYWDPLSGSNNPVIYSNGNSLSVYGDFELTAGVYNDLYYVYFYSDKYNINLDFGDNLHQADANTYWKQRYYFYNNYSWDLNSDIDAYRIYISSGTFSTNGYNITLENYLRFYGTFDAGTSDIYVTYLQSYGTFNAGSSNIFIQEDPNGNTPYIDGSQTYNNVDIESGLCDIYQDNTYNNLSINNGSGINLESGTTQTINSSLTALGVDRGNLATIQSRQPGNQANIYMAGAGIFPNADYIIITDNYIYNDAAWIFSPTNAIDGGNNTNWDFSVSPLTSLDYYWINGSGTWSDASHWQTSSDGGLNFSATSEGPAPIDNVFFTSSSFPGGGTVTIDQSYTINDMTWEAGSGTTHPQIYGDWNAYFTVKGDFTLDDGVARRINRLVFDSSNGSNNIYTADNYNVYGDTFFRGGGNWNLLGDIYIGASTIIEEGTLNTNDFSVTSYYGFSINSDLSTLNLGSSDVYLYDGFYNNATTPTINPGTSTFYFGNTWGGNTQINSPYGTTPFNNVVISNSTYIYGTSTFATLTANPGAELILENGMTQTITGSLDLQGNRSKLVNIKSTSQGTPATLLVTGATVNADFISIEDNIIDNGLATDVSATNAVDNLGNTGWAFSAIVPLDYYWIGGTGSWSDISHWQSSPDGGNTFASVTDPPGVVDNIYFNSNSFPSGGTLTLDSDVQCNDMTWQSGSGSSFPTIYSNYELAVHGSLQLANGVNRNISRLNFDSDGTGNTIDLADNLYNWGDIDFNGTGNWSLMSDLSTAYLNLRGGTLNTNDHTINIEQQMYLDYNSTGTVNWGASVVNLRNIYCDSPGITFNAQTSTFNFMSTGSSCNFNGGYPVSFNDVNILNDLNLNNAYTFNNLTINPGVKVQLEPGITQTINNSFTAEGTRSQMIEIKTYTPGSDATLAINTGSASLSVDYVIFQDNILDNGSGFTTTEIASNSLDNGNNTGWDFSTTPLTSLDYYWIGGTGNWSDISHWASADGGSSTYPDPPGTIDNVNFTSNSFPSGGTVTLDIPASCSNMTWNDGSFNPTIYGDYNNRLTISGNLNIADGVNRNLEYIEFNSSSNNQIDLGDNRYQYSNLIFRGGGTWSLIGSVESNQIEFYEGTLTTNDQTITLENEFYLNGSLPITLNFGNSEIYTQRISNYASNVMGDGGGHIFLSDNGGLYGNNPIGVKNFTIEGDATIYNQLDVSNTLTIQPGGKLMINPSYPLTVGALVADGTRPSPVTIQSTNEGVQSTISQASGTVDAHHIILKDNNATGGASFVATDAYNKGNVTGWAITAIVSQDYYWMASTGDWSDRNSWSLSDGSNVIPATVPGPADNIFITTNSPISSGGTMNLDIPVECNNMTWSSGISGAIIFGDYDTPLTIHGSFSTVAGVQLSFDRMNFDSDLAGNIIDLGGNAGNQYIDMYFTGSGDWTLSNDFIVGNIYFQGGTLNTSGFLVESDYLSLYNGSTTFSTLNLGSSDVNLNYFEGSGTLNAETSTIYFNDNTRVYGSWAFNNVEIDGDARFYDNNSFNMLTILPGSTVSFKDGGTQTVSSLNVTGERSRPITIKSTQDGTQATIVQASGAVDGAYLILQDNNALGGAAFSAQNSIDNGNVTGWNIGAITPRDYYWVGGTGMWSEASTHWANADNGTNFFSESPGPLDNVFFTANSFASDGTLTLDYPVSVHNMDWTGNTSFVSVSGGGDNLNSLTIGGSLTLANGVSRDFDDLFFDSDATGNTIFMADNLNSGSSVYFYGSGDWSLTGSYDAYYTEFNGGTFYTNNNDFSSQYIRLSNDNISYWGSSDVTTWRFYNYLNNANNFNSETSTFHFDQLYNNYITGSSRFFITMFNGDTYINGNNIFFNANHTIGLLRLSSNQSFNSLTLDAGTALSIADGSTQTISAALDLNGDAENPVIINSFNEGNAGILSVPPTGTVSANYVHLKDNTATGGADFTATNSSDFGNVTGWNGLLTGQTIDFAPLDDIPLTDGSFDVSASATSSLGVTFEIASGSATINGTTVTPSAAGLIGIRALQSGDGTYGSALPVIRYTHIDATNEPNELGNMKAAKLALGQPDFVTNDQIYTDLTVPRANQVAISSTGVMAVANGSRVMIWNTIPSGPDVPADVVLGHPDFTTDISNTVSESAFADYVYSVAFAGNKLIVGDAYRALIWNTIPTTNGAPADIVIGQSDFTSVYDGVSQTQYAGDNAICVSTFSSGGNTQLIVSDAGNNRVLIYNTVPTSSGAAADVVIGQADFDSNTYGSQANELDFPFHTSVGPDGKLFIADYGNSRVLMFNSIPSSNGASADMVLGQVDFGNSDGAVGPTNFDRATGVSVSRTGRLAIADYINNRVLIYNSIPTDNSIAPDFVLGQPDAFSNVQNYNSISARSLFRPISVDWDASENLFVSDNANNRALIYGAADLDGPTITGTSLLQPNYTMGGSNQVSTISVTDRSGISNAIAFFQSVDNFDNTNPAYEQSPLTDLGNGDFEFDVSVIESLNPSPTGIEYFIEVYDNLGNVTSTGDNIQVLPVYYPNGTTIDGYGVGSTTESYRIMAIPLDLDNASVNSVFGGLIGGTYDNTVMRIFSYAGGTTTDYTEASGTTNLQVGKGYFALAKAGSGTTITSPAGATSFTSADDGSGNNIHEFDITLVPGWNLIGNPFQHNVVWADVEALSGISGEVDQLQGYSGSYSTITSIPAGKGAFVHNNTSSNFTLRIPAKEGTGGRIEGIAENENPLNSPSWEVWLKSNDSNGNEIVLGGVGMEQDADFSKDRFDWLNPPAFAHMKVIDFNHPEFMTHSFKKDIRQTNDEEKWSFSYKVEDLTNEKQELYWDNTHFGDNTPDIFLVDKTHFVTVNMKEESSYTFNHGGETKFDIYFGYDALERIMPDDFITQSPFPNPFSHEITFTLGLPDDQNYNVDIQIFDAVGRTVRYISKGGVEPGYNSIVWDGLDKEGQQIPSGIYTYNIYIKGSKRDIVKYGKVIKQ